MPSPVRGTGARAAAAHGQHTIIIYMLLITHYRAQEVSRQHEAQVQKLQQLMAHEAEEMAQLHAFESQVSVGEGTAAHV